MFQKFEWRLDKLHLLQLIVVLSKSLSVYRLPFQLPFPPASFYVEIEQWAKNYARFLMDTSLFIHHQDLSQVDIILSRYKIRK